MAKFKLSDWAHISEIAASIVVVLSLIYVGLEVNQNTVALQQASYQSVQDGLQELDITLITNPDLLRIVTTAKASPSELSPEEWLTFTHYAYPMTAIWEYLYLAKQEQAISDFQWTAFDPYFLSFACQLGYRRFWEENRRGFSVAFGKYFDSRLKSNCLVD